MKNNEPMFQEIQVKLKFSPEQKINPRLFSWRLPNFNQMSMSDIVIDQEKGEVSFTSSFNAEFSKDYIKNFIEKNSAFYSGEFLGRFEIPVEVIEIKEEAEIYGNI